MNILDGKKTYLGAALLMALGLLFGFGIITKEQFESYITVAGGITAIGFRNAMDK